MPRRKNRNALRLLSLAACAGLGMYHLTDDTVTGGGGGDKKVDDKKPADKTEPAKLALTQEELDAKVAAAVKASEDKAAAAAKKKQDDDEAEAARKRGEFETLATKEKERADALDAENRRLKRDAALTAHLADKHAEYLTCAKYIAPLIDAEAEGDELAKAVADAATQYVNDNPRTPKGAGAPAKQPVTGNRQQGGGTSNGDRLHHVPQRVGIADGF